MIGGATSNLDPGLLLEKLLPRDLQALDVNSLMQQVKLAKVEQGSKCKYSDWYFLDESTGEKVAMNCHSWECSECRKKLGVRWAHRFISAQPKRWFTITNVPGEIAVCRSKWQQFVRAIRRGYGKRESSARAFADACSQILSRMRIKLSDQQWAVLCMQTRRGYRIEYARVLERGSRTGMRHYHVLYRGDRISQLVVVALASIFGFGYVGHEGEIFDEGGCWYVSKYLSKSGGEAGWRKVTTSRRMVPKGVEEGGDWSLVSPGCYRTGVSVAALAVIDRRYAHVRNVERSERLIGKVRNKGYIEWEERSTQAGRPSIHTVI